MKATVYERVLFGLSAVVAGVVMLVRHDSDMWQRLAPLWTPLATLIVWSFSVALVASGLAIISPRTARVGSLVLAGVYIVLSLACFQDIIGAPAQAGSYVEIFELFSVACGALALYALTNTGTQRNLGLVRFTRLAFGVCTLSFAWAQVAFFAYTSSLVPVWVPPNQAFWTTLTTIAFALAGIAMLINVRALLAFRLSALMMGLFGLLVWVPHIIAQPAQLSNWTEISANYLMTAAAWIVGNASSSVEAT